MPVGAAVARFRRLRSGSRRRRVPYEHVTNIEDVVSVVRRAGDERLVVIMDVEMTITPCCPSPEDLSRALQRTAAMLHPVVQPDRLYFISNSNDIVPPPDYEHLGVTLVTGAKKPFGPVPHLREALGGSGWPVVVVGDQPLTDGLLAWALQGRFVSFVLPGPELPWPTLQRRIGTFLLPFFTKRQPITDPPITDPPARKNAALLR